MGSASEKLAWSLIHPGVSSDYAGDRMPSQRGRSKKRGRSSSSSSSSSTEDRRRRRRRKKRQKKRLKRNQPDDFFGQGAKFSSKGLRSHDGIEGDGGNDPASSFISPSVLSSAGRVPPIRKGADSLASPKDETGVYDSQKRVFPNRISLNDPSFGFNNVVYVIIFHNFLQTFVY